jgi:hypothetical protein
MAQTRDGDLSLYVRIADIPVQAQPEATWLQNRLLKLALSLDRSLQLPKSIRVTVNNCGQPLAEQVRVDGAASVIIACTETRSAASRIVLARLGNIPLGAVANPPLDSTAPWVDGAVRFIAAHEVAHILMATYGAAGLGDEEAAADQLAAILLLRDNAFSDVTSGSQFLESIARLEGPAPIAASKSRHGWSLQRAERVRCMLAGSVPFEQYPPFEVLAAKYHLGTPREAECEAEYKDALAAWTRVLRPVWRN